MSAESLFERCVGRQATDPERNLLFRLQKELRLHDDDPVWSILVGAQVVTDLLQRIPQDVQKASEAAAQASAARTHELYTKHVTSAVDMQRFTAEFQAWMKRTVFGVFAIVAAGCFITFWGTKRYADEAIARASMDAVSATTKELSAAWNYALNSKVRELLPEGYKGVADQVAALAAIQLKQPGAFKAIARLDLAALAKAEEANPGSLAFATSQAGQFYHRMYKANGGRVCHEERVERRNTWPIQGSKEVLCVNVNPDRSADD